MSLYRVRPGFSFGAFNQYGPGALVELTDLEAGGFMDKLEPAGEPATDASTLTADDALPPAWMDFGDLSKYMNMIRLLVANGYDTPAAVQMADDAELLAIRGIGPKALGALRSVLGNG